MSTVADYGRRPARAPPTSRRAAFSLPTVYAPTAMKRALPERDLPARAREHGEAGEHAEVVAAVGELEVAVGAHLVATIRSTPATTTTSTSERSSVLERIVSRAAVTTARGHTRRSRVAANRPVGRIISTMMRITSAASGTSAEPS